jgi:hypothetical protein
MKYPSESRKPVQSAVDVQRALEPIASLIRKSENALHNVTAESWQYAMLRDNLKALHLAGAMQAG